MSGVSENSCPLSVTTNSLKSTLECKDFVSLNNVGETDNRKQTADRKAEFWVKLNSPLGNLRLQNRNLTFVHPTQLYDDSLSIFLEGFAKNSLFWNNFHNFLFNLNNG